MYRDVLINKRKEILFSLTGFYLSPDYPYYIVNGLVLIVGGHENMCLPAIMETKLFRNQSTASLIGMLWHQMSNLIMAPYERPPCDVIQRNVQDRQVFPFLLQNLKQFSLQTLCVYKTNTQ